mgnify:CR=1 FL=1
MFKIKVDTKSISRYELRDGSLDEIEELVPPEGGWVYTDTVDIVDAEFIHKGKPVIVKRAFLTTVTVGPNRWLLADVPAEIGHAIYKHFRSLT